MGFLDRFLGKKSKKSNDDADFYNKEVIDFRDDKEISMDKQARFPLSSEDEEVAKQIVDLLYDSGNIYRKDEGEFLRREAEVRKIGEFLCKNGGMDRMVLIAYRVGHIGSSLSPRVSQRLVEHAWNGVCGWMY